MVVLCKIKWIFNTTPPFLKYKNIIKMNQYLMVFILVIIYPKDGAYITNLDEYFDIGTCLVALWVNINNNVTYFDSFVVEHMP